MRVIITLIAASLALLLGTSAWADCGCAKKQASCGCQKKATCGCAKQTCGSEKHESCGCGHHNTCGGDVQLMPTPSQCNDDMPQCCDRAPYTICCEQAHFELLCHEEPC